MVSEPAGRPNGGGVGRWQLRLAALSALVLAFFAGLALGWGVARRTPPAAWERAGGGASGGGAQRRSRPRAEGAPRQRGGPGGGFGPLDQLDLTPAQRAAVDSILAARRAQIDAFWRGDGQRLRQIIDSTGIDMRAVLDSSQRAAFDSLREQHRRRDDPRMRGGRPPFGSGGGAPFPGGPPPPRP